MTVKLPTYLLLAVLVVVAGAVALVPRDETGLLQTINLRGWLRRLRGGA